MVGISRPSLLQFSEAHKRDGESGGLLLERGGCQIASCSCAPRLLQCPAAAQLADDFPSSLLMPGQFKVCCAAPNVGCWLRQNSETMEVGTCCPWHRVLKLVNARHSWARPWRLPCRSLQRSPHVATISTSQATMILKGLATGQGTAIHRGGGREQWWRFLDGRSQLNSPQALRNNLMALVYVVGPEAAIVKSLRQWGLRPSSSDGLAPISREIQCSRCTGKCCWRMFGCGAPGQFGMGSVFTLAARLDRWLKRCAGSMPPFARSPAPLLSRRLGREGERGGNL